MSDGPTRYYLYIPVWATGRAPQGGGSSNYSTPSGSTPESTSRRPDGDVEVVPSGAVAQVLTHERIADLHELRRRETDLFVALQQHRVLGREAQAAVDGDEPVVRAELHAADGAGDGRERRLGPGTEPLVLGSPRHVAVQARHVERRDTVARLERLDRLGRTVGEHHRRAREDAVGPGAGAAGTAPARARTTRPRAARPGPAWTRPTGAAAAAAGSATARRPAAGRPAAR